METTTEPTQKKQKTDIKFYRDLFQDFGIILDQMENEPTPQGLDRSLVRASSLYKDILDDYVFDAKIRLGLSKFLKRAKRRAGRKPLTTKKMQNLNDDLKALAEILKI